MNNQTPTPEALETLFAPTFRINPFPCGSHVRAAALRAFLQWQDTGFDLIVEAREAFSDDNAAVLARWSRARAIGHGLTRAAFVVLVDGPVLWNAAVLVRRFNSEVAPLVSEYLKSENKVRAAAEANSVVLIRGAMNTREDALAAVCLELEAVAHRATYLPEDRE